MSWASSAPLAGLLSPAGPSPNPAAFPECLRESGTVLGAQGYSQHLMGPGPAQEGRRASFLQNLVARVLTNSGQRARRLPARLPPLPDPRTLLVQLPQLTGDLGANVSLHHPGPRTKPAAADPRQLGAVVHSRNPASQGRLQGAGCPCGMKRKCPRGNPIGTVRSL